MLALDIEAALVSAIGKQTAAAASIFIPPTNVRNYTCSVQGCIRGAYAGGFCNAHYIRARKGMALEPPVRARKRSDQCEECGKQTGAKGGWGLCPKHYKRKRYEIIKLALIDSFGGKCSACKSSFPISVYDFHHLGSKEDAASTLLLNASLSEIARELSKCVLLCANCHRIEHHGKFR